MQVRPIPGLDDGINEIVSGGPDQLHRIVIAKSVLKCYHEGMSRDFGV
tara:strand:+ start:438 stop:581 length:144 start_codon:yes stop_codon:yes gene_type:complete